MKIQFSVRIFSSSVLILVYNIYANITQVRIA